MKNTTQNGLWTVQFGELGATLKVLQDQGVTPEHLARLRAEPDYAKRVAEFMLRGGLNASVHQKLARAIMGKNFWGVEDWAAMYGVNFSQKHLRQVAEFPWSEDVLNSTCPFCGQLVKDCHFAFLGMERINGKPLTILKWQDLHPATGQPKFYSYAPDVWYSSEKFAKDITMSLRWYLLHKSIVPKSESKTFDDQKAMLTVDYEVPSAITEVSKDLLVFRKTGNFVNPSRWARTEDVTSGGHRVIAGSCDRDGVGVNGYLDGHYDYNLGVAASRKF